MTILDSLEHLAQCAGLAAYSLDFDFPGACITGVAFLTLVVRPKGLAPSQVAALVCAATVLNRLTLAIDQNKAFVAGARLHTGQGALGVRVGTSGWASTAAPLVHTVGLTFISLRNGKRR